MDGANPDMPAPLDALLCDFARTVARGQGLARRLGFLAAGVEESVEDVMDFHAAIETLVGAAPVTDSARAMRDRLSDDDRRLLRETRSARNELVYDFFIDFPLATCEHAPDPHLLARARARLDELAAVLEQARRLTDRLEQALSKPPGADVTPC